MVGGISGISSIAGLFPLLLLLIICYLIIRLAVRHAIDSSETAQIIKKQYAESKDDKQQ